MALPLIGAAARMAAKKLAEKGGKKATKNKPMEPDELMRNVTGTSLATSGAAGATAMLLGKDDRQKKVEEKTEQKEREAKDEVKRETRGMKKGGSVKSSASKRADGIAIKGKTRGKMV